ncbi:MAG: DUF3421 domain-containing protein [Coxiellaceae bacterium]|nr:DUF3421 domain-containing protein [Coxiellaceae bacterium]
MIKLILRFSLAFFLLAYVGLVQAFPLTFWKNNKQQALVKQQQCLSLLKKFKQLQSEINFKQKNLTVKQLQSLIKQQKQAQTVLQQAMQLQRQVSSLNRQKNAQPDRPRAQPTSPYYHWIKSSIGKQVDHMLTAGYNQKGAIHVCRAYYKDGTHPGQLTQQGCLLSYAGKAFFVKQYAVLTSQLPAAWLLANQISDYQNQFLPSPLHAGYEQMHSLYSCWVIYHGQPHVGKTVTGACDIGYKGKEVRVGSQYYVLSAMR